MKTSRDPRHLRRLDLVKSLYAATIRNQANAKTKHVWAHLPALDARITISAPQWPLAKINPVDLAILRLAVYELLIDKSVPVKVIIDEAVEIAKTLGSQSSPGFINGVLGHIVKNYES